MDPNPETEIKLQEKKQGLPENAREFMQGILSFPSDCGLHNVRSGGKMKGTPRKKARWSPGR